MARPRLRSISRTAVAVAATASALALLWAIWWLWSRLSPQWDNWTIIAVAILALTLLTGIWWLWWYLPQRQIAKLALKIRDPKARADTEDNFRKTVGQALGGAAVLIGGVAAYLQLTQQQQASHELLISNQVGKSFEQLGGAETATRLGGIYGLEGVMNTSSEYHQPVLEALCAFVRERTTPRQATFPAWLQALVSPANERTAGKVNDTPPTDVQAALTVIGRRAPGPGSVDLTGASISGANLRAAHLEGANLSQAHLEGANFGEAHLGLADFRSARLDRAFLSGAHLELANFSYAQLDRAFLSGAHFDRARLIESHLGGADLSAAFLEGANLWSAYLEGANLRAAHLEGADLHWAHLDLADLQGAHLEGADLSGADGLTQEQLEAAYGGITTRLPAGLTRPAHWTTTAPK